VLVKQVKQAKVLNALLQLEAAVAVQTAELRQYLHFCSSKASKAKSSHSKARTEY